MPCGGRKVSKLLISTVIRTLTSVVKINFKRYTNTLKITTLKEIRSKVVQRFLNHYEISY